MFPQTPNRDYIKVPYRMDGLRCSMERVGFFTEQCDGRHYLMRQDIGANLSNPAVYALPAFKNGWAVRVQ